MLDEITYKRDDRTGQIVKQVRRLESLADVKSEIAAIEAQLADIESGEGREPSIAGADAIVNYRAQVKELKRLAKVV